MSKKPKPDIRLFFKQRDLSELNDTTTLSSSHHHEDTEAELVPAPTCPSNDLGDLGGGPARPVLQHYPLTDFPGSRKRSFSLLYYKKYEWVEYSINNDAVFCFACRQFSSSNREELFVEKGMTNWKKTGEKLDKHAISAAHSFSMSKWVEYRKPTQSVSTLLSDSHKELLLENRDYLKKVIDILLYLSKQGLPLRGHDESDESDNKGNFLELCNFFSKYDEKFKEKYNKYFNMTSPDVQNELLCLIKTEVLRVIVDEINSSGFFSLMVDEAKSHRTQQLCICVRYLVGQEIKERVIAMEDVSLSRSALSLADVIFKKIGDLGLSALMVGQAYDGASVMSGIKNGLQAIVKKRNPYAIYVHCLAHKVNLVLVAACKDNDLSCNFFNIMQCLYIYFSYPDTHAEFKIVQKELNITGPGPNVLHKLSDTRWSCRATSVLSVKRNYSVVIAALTATASDMRNPKNPEAKGLLSSVTSLDFIVCLSVFSQYLPLINVLSQSLQKADSSIAQSATVAKGVIEELADNRNEDSWTIKWQDIKNFDKEFNLRIFQDEDAGVSIAAGSSSKPKRPRMISKNLDDFVICSSVGQRNRDYMYSETNNVLKKDNLVKNKYKNIFYYPLLEILTEELKRRFSGEALEIANASEQFIRVDEVGAEPFIKMFSIPEVDPNILKAEMAVLRRVVESSGICLQTKPLKEIVAKLMEVVLKTGSETYKHFGTLLKIALVLPSNSATCERSFSAMRRIHNWLRCTMGEERMNNLMILHSESDVVRNLELESLVDAYSLKKERRKIALL